MNKEFIPYEQALELRKLGFDEECLAYWTSGINGYNIEYKHYTNKHWMFTANDHKDRDKMCTAPLYQQAFRWFREKHNLCGFISYFNADGIEYTFQIVDLYNEKEIYESFFGASSSYVGTYNKYEEAELVCLKKLIEIVKK
jgi:hypothetical protein